MEDTCLLDILEEDNRCYGGNVRLSNGELKKITADVAVLASGGVGGLYTNSTNFKHLTGDALAISLKHGIELKDMSYVQIHPTTLYQENPKERSFLISESVRGDIRVLLSGERTALNYLQRMSGIATYTHEMTDLLKDSPITLLDSRKTTPNNRIFEKYAIKVGGGKKHRYNLSDGVLLKDNHIDAAGGVKEAVLAAKAYAPSVRKIEIEVETLDMVKETVEAGADIIMLDNMEYDIMKEAVALIDGRAEIEISGNVTRENLASYTGLAVQYVSSGAITHSANILDLSLKNLHPVEN